MQSAELRRSPFGHSSSSGALMCVVCVDAGGKARRVVVRRVGTDLSRATSPTMRLLSALL